MAHDPKDTPTQHQCIAALDAIHATVSALRCLDTLLDLALFHDGGALSDKNSGLHNLLSRQLDDIKECEETLRRFVRASQNRANTSRGLPPDMVILPNYRPGLEDELRAVAAVQPDTVARIARDTNLKEETVRKVLARLQADPGEGAAPVAVNG